MTVRPLHEFLRDVGVGAALALWSAFAVAAQLTVVQVAPQTGLDANQGRAYAAGLRLLFKKINDDGGVNGHTLHLVTHDDGSQPSRTLAATKQLLTEVKPIVLAGYFGSMNVAELANSRLLESERIALVGYRVSQVAPDYPQMYSVRATLRDEIEKLTQHLATVGITELALLHEGGAGADALIESAEIAARKAGATFLKKVSYPAGTAAVTRAVSDLASTKLQAIVLVASGAATAGFIEQYRNAGGTAQLFAHSGADIEQLAKRLSEEQMQGVAIAQVTPSPYKISSRLTKEFADAAGKSKDLDVPVSYSMIEGYIAAKVIAEAIRRQGGKPTREGTLAALSNMSTFDLGGYVVGFTSGSRTGSKFVELSIITGQGRIRQ